MGDKSFTNSGFESLFNESLEEASSLRNQVTKLTSSNEEYQQTIHVLRRELETAKAMNQEIKDLYEDASIQRSETLNIAIQQLTDKFSEERKVFHSRIKELEDDLVLRGEENLILESQNKLLKQQEKLPAIQEETTFEETTTLTSTEENDSKVKELMIILEERDNNFVELEKFNASLQNQITDLQSIIQDFRTRMEEKNQIIENTQEELANCRIELNALKTAPTDGDQKGNSLFAEVEDRRQHMLEKMKSMRSSYLEMQRTFKLKENQIKTLKLERATLLRQYEETCLESVEQEEALFDSYKTRIRDLENRLKEEQKKSKELQKEQETNSNMNYLQTLLKSKKKDIEELQTQIENNSIRTLLKEEFSYKLKSRLRYWKYKALSLEANLSALQNQLQENPNYSTSEIQQLLKNQISNKSLKIDDDFEDEPESSLQQKVLDETSFSLEKLIQPKALSNFDSTLTSEISKNESCSDLDTTVLCNFNKEESNNIGKTLNFTKDMSMTQPIETTQLNDSSSLEETTIIANDRNDATSLSKISKTLNFTNDMSMTQPIQTNMNRPLKVEMNQDLDDFQPVSTSSRLDDIQQKFKVKESNKENASSASNSSILKSTLPKTLKCTNEMKEKKVLRFTEDTIEPKTSYIRELKAKRVNYPIVYISSEESNK